MSFLLSPELNEFRAVLRKFFAAEVSSACLRKNLLSGPSARRPEDPELTTLWKKIIELGGVSAALPEDCGGLGFGPVAASVVLEESSRVLLPLPLFETITFGVLALQTAEPAVPAAALLSEIVEGKWRASGSAGYSADFSVFAKPGADLASGSVLLTGKLPLVPSIEQVDALIVPAKSGDGRAYWCFLSLAEQTEATLKSSRLKTFDLLRSSTDVELEAAPARIIAETKKPFSSITEELSLAAAAELAGCAGRVVEMTVEYVKTRSQFGRPVGSFQAIQHKLADMLVVSEQAASLCRFAAWCMTADKKQLPMAVNAAKAFASEHVPLLCESAIQIHGGIGFTYEYDLHLFLRRALVLSRAFQSAEAGCLSLGEKFLNS